MRLLLFKREKHYLSAVEAQNLLMYGFKNMTLEEAVLKEVDDLELAIKSKSGIGYRVTTKTYQDWKKELVEKLAEHFKENGFVSDIYKNPRIPNTLILIIGW